LVSLILGVLSLVLALLAFSPPVRDYVDRRRHVRDVRAGLEPVWRDDEVSTHWRSRLLTGVHLSVHNSSRWPVFQVTVIDPPTVRGEVHGELPAGESWVFDLPSPVTHDDALAAPGRR
jgi:hypothetical protein